MSHPQVLLVDDEPNVLQSLRRLLRREPIELVTVTSPAEALARVQAEPFAVVISDQRMPEMEGTELLERVQAASPDTVRIILTGHAEMEAALDAINRGAVYRFLCKPWDDEELQQTLRHAVERYELVEENQRLHRLTEAQNAKLQSWNSTLIQKVFERTREIVASNRELDQSLLQSVKVIAGMIGNHSEVLGNHSLRVAQVATAMARKMDLGFNRTQDIKTAALLHDIGKMSIQRSALAKPAHTHSLNTKREILEHPMRGAAMIGTISHFSNAASLIRHHHERFDGTGYPDGLCGDDIPLGARIIAVADAYDNELNGRRSHLWKVPHQAVASVRRRAPDEFDPYLVHVLAEAVLDKDGLEAFARIHSDTTQQQDGIALSSEGDVEEELASDELSIDIRLLSLGMVLSRELRDMSDRLLLPKDSVMDEANLERIHLHHHKTPIRGNIYVYRSSES